MREGPVGGVPNNTDSARGHLWHSSSSGPAGRTNTGRYRGIGETLNRLEDIERSAAGLGVSAEAVQELEYTFKQFRLESDDVADALATLSGEAQEIKDGTKKAAEAFDLFGVSVRSLRGKSPDQLFELVADRIRRIEDPTARSARAVAVFGDDLGRKLLPLLIQGGEGLDQYARKAHALGVVLDQDVVTNGGDAAQTFRDIGAQINADFTHAVAENAQAFERLGDALGTIITTGATLTGWFADFGRGLGEATARAMGFTTIEDRIVDLEDQIQARMVTRQRLASTFGANDPRTQQLDAELKKLRELKAAQQSLIDFQPAGKPMRLGAIDVQAKAPAGVSSPSAAAAHEFRPLDGYLAQLDRNWADNFLKVEESAGALTEKLKESVDVTAKLRDIGQQATQTLASGFADAIVSGENLGDTFKSLLADIAKMTIRQTILNAVMGAFGGGGTGGGLFSLLASAKGNVFDERGVVPFAKGGVVDRPTVFPFRNGAGLMGEAGPEAIMPLKRLAGGQLGVQAAAAAPIVNVINQGHPLEVERTASRRGPDGQMIIEVMVRDAMERMIGSGQMDSTFAANFGARRPGRY